MSDVFDQALQARKQRQIDAFAGVTFGLEEKITEHVFRLIQPVDVDLGTETLRVTQVRVRSGFTADPHPDEAQAWIQVEGYGRPLTAKGQVSQRSGAVWRYLPDELSTLFPITN